jgi:hypothetical protein
MQRRGNWTAMASAKSCEHTRAGWSLSESDGRGPRRSVDCRGQTLRARVSQPPGHGRATQRLAIVPTKATVVSFGLPMHGSVRDTSGVRLANDAAVRWPMHGSKPGAPPAPGPSAIPAGDWSHLGAVHSAPALARSSSVTATVICQRRAVPAASLATSVGGQNMNKVRSLLKQLRPGRPERNDYGPLSPVMRKRRGSQRPYLIELRTNQARRAAGEGLGRNGRAYSHLSNSARYTTLPGRAHKGDPRGDIAS